MVTKTLCENKCYGYTFETTMAVVSITVDMFYKLRDESTLFSVVIDNRPLIYPKYSFIFVFNIFLKNIMYNVMFIP